MGSQQTGPSSVNKAALKTSHPNLQKSFIVRQDNREYIQTPFPIQQQHYNQWRSNVSKTAGHVNSEFLFLPLDMGYVQNNEMCAKSGYTVINYPAYPMTLADAIKTRQGTKEYFKEGQLYYLLYALVAAKVDANTRNELVGDIKPDNVFINKDEKIKVGCLHSFPFERTNYAKITDSIAPQYNVLVAPEDLEYASDKKLDNKANKNSQIFSIGATILSAGILDDLSSLYSFPTKEFNLSEHNKKTVEWLDHSDYSEIFKSIILNLLNPQAEKRMNIGDLHGFVEKYKASILAKEQFMVCNPPLSIETGVSVIRSKIH